MVAPALKYESNWTEKYIFVNHLCRPFIWESLRNFIFSRPNDDSWKLERTALKSCKLLGVHINEHLKWDDHIKHTVSGCYATLSILRKLKYLAKYELRKQLAETLILSKLDYADLVFYPLPQFLLCHLQRVQFAAASFVLGHYVKSFRDVLTIGWLPINERRDLNLLKSCFLLLLL